MLAFLKFDDEDTYYPPEYRMDDVSKWLAEIMTEASVTGSLCVMGARARLLKERGRDDVIQAMTKHDLISHQAANIRPKFVNILSDKEWHDGMDAVLEYEGDSEVDLRLLAGEAFHPFQNTLAVEVTKDRSATGLVLAVSLISGTLEAKK